eukprot:scaffold193826_cov31-Attheya_sp.AAC.2
MRSKPLFEQFALLPISSGFVVVPVVELYSCQLRGLDRSHAVVGTKIPVRTIFNHRAPANNTQKLFPRSLVKKAGKRAGCDAMAWLTCLDGWGWDVARMH